MPAGFDGKLYDGLSAKAQAVRVTPTSRFVEVEGASGRESIGLDLLRRENHAASVTLHRTDLPDWRLTLRSEAARDLASIQKLHAMTGRHWRNIGLSVAGVAAVGALFWFGGGAVVEAVAPMVPVSVTKPAGEQYAAIIIGEEGECKAPAGRAALDAMIARVTPRQGFVMPVRVRVTNSDTVNAITLPGGEVIVFKGLIDAAQSPEELAGVIAHEFGHVQHYHSNEALIRQFGFSVFLEGIGGNIGGLAATGLMLANTRDAEREADGEAISLMKQGNVSPMGLSAFFDRMGGMGPADEKTADAAKAREEEEGIGSLFATHPGDASRRARFAKAAKGISAKPVLDASQWQALRGICAGAK
jgi:beta-barrel assembly-enhancing protease